MRNRTRPGHKSPYTHQIWSPHIVLDRSSRTVFPDADGTRPGNFSEKNSQEDKSTHLQHHDTGNTSSRKCFLMWPAGILRTSGNKVDPFCHVSFPVMLLCNSFRFRKFTKSFANRSASLLILYVNLSLGYCLSPLCLFIFICGIPTFRMARCFFLIGYFPLWRCITISIN
ncbi:hypothetical protein TBLA_0C01390 [Henningerozyma blattae CBS 6284]|uniref:Uncharacterized protein n=1 Tax=Henningerozyma blattae (strain ATCC 34711 / CBS 6284 / DSM 70876 / NBRC 10599 / NRRL Y-10934 / UCD 77-7) TaxID=1071380 RepID=I2H0Q2_HENB6|nr:hypothetical protein TBLA_0C01390 [Tetrapisispora blattae CBS 6284]CCH59954.1 hypothetical protein TBLA_0C01390 [Tetrapisispora blattae CBS 6284]